MTDQQIQQLINNAYFVEKYGETKLISTHISYVLLTKEVVFKIKKPQGYVRVFFRSKSAEAYWFSHSIRITALRPAS